MQHQHTICTMKKKIQKYMEHIDVYQADVTLEELQKAKSKTKLSVMEKKMKVPRNYFLLRYWTGRITPSSFTLVRGREKERKECELRTGESLYPLHKSDTNSHEEKTYLRKKKYMMNRLKKTLAKD